MAFLLKRHMKKIKLKDFKVGDEVEFVKKYNAQHPIEYYGYVPPISKGTKGTVAKITDSAIHVKVEGIDNLVALWDGLLFLGPMQDKIDCIKVIKKGTE